MLNESLAYTLKTWFSWSLHHSPPSVWLTLRRVSCISLPQRGQTYGRLRAAAELSHQTLFPSNTLGKEYCSSRKKLNIIKIKVLKLTLTTTVSLWIMGFLRAARSFHLLHYICPHSGAALNYA